MLGLSVGIVGQWGQKWGDELETEARQAPIHLSFSVTAMAFGKYWPLLHFCLLNITQVPLLVNSNQNPQWERNSRKCSF